MQLTIGKTYKTRAGHTHGPMRVAPFNPDMLTAAEGIAHWTKDGVCMGGGYWSMDLVEEVK